MPWTTVEGTPLGDAALGFMGGERAPFYRQLKYPDEEAGINLSSGREMRLIEAEAMLDEGDWQGAMAILNARRDGLGLEPWPAADITEAWTIFKRERGIELWLEGRRMSDLRRWQETNTPGALHPLETPGHPDSWLSADQTLCYDIPDEEREANPNVPNRPGG